MKEDGQDSAIKELDQPFEDSNQPFEDSNEPFEGSNQPFEDPNQPFEGSEDWNLNIDDSSQEILHPRPVMTMGKCPMHCMGGACMHGFTNVAPSMSPIKAGYQCPPEAPKKIKNFIGPTPSTPERPLPPIKLNPFRIRPSISPIKIRYNYLFQNPLLNDAEFDRLPAMWVTDPSMD